MKDSAVEYVGASFRARLGWIAVLIVVGLSSKFYRGWGEHWFNNSLGGVFYVVFWCSFWDLLEPKRRASQIAIAVLVVTSVLECFQLSRHPVLEWIRGYFIGRTLIGTTFVSWDFFYYVIGALSGYSWIRWLRQDLNRPS